MLKELLSPTNIRNLAGAKAYKAAEKLAKSGAVRSIVEDEERVSATIGAAKEGQPAEIWAEGERVRWACGCTEGRTGAFCEHLAALAQVHLRIVVPAAPKKKPGATSAIGQLREHLAAMSAPDLVSLIMEQAQGDRKLKDRLLLRVRINQQHAQFDEREAAKMLVAAARRGGFIYTRNTSEYAHQIHSVVDAIEPMIAQGQGDGVARVLEQGIRIIDAALAERIDDSNGFVYDCLHRLVMLHRTACAASHPEPKALAQRLFDLGVNSKWGNFDDAVEEYRELLNDEALELYGELVDDAFEQLGPRQQKSSDSLASSLRRMKESLVKVFMDSE